MGSELAVVRDLESYSNCPVPLHAVINRERYADGHTDQWVLLDTKRIADPAQTRTEYALRTVVEERYPAYFTKRTRKGRPVWHKAFV